MAKDKVKIIQRIQNLKKIKIIHLVRKKINKSLQLDFSKYKIIKINNIINKLLLPIISNKSNKLLNKTSSASLLRLVYADPQLAQLPQAVTDIKNNKILSFYTKNIFFVVNINKNKI